MITAEELRNKQEVILSKKDAHDLSRIEELLERASKTTCESTTYNNKVSQNVVKKLEALRYKVKTRHTQRNGAWTTISWKT